MEIIITQWALNSYLELKHKNAFSSEDYRNILRPDVLLLKNFQTEPKFQIQKFWSPASYRKNTINHGFKMKWHNIGNGLIQLRLCVAMIEDTAYLCSSYAKSGSNQEARKLALFENQVQLILEDNFTECGRLK